MTPPPWNFFENSSDLVACPVPKKDFAPMSRTFSFSFHPKVLKSQARSRVWQSFPNLGK